MAESQQHIPPDYALSNNVGLLGRVSSQQSMTLASHFSRGALIGETLPEQIDLYPIPRHETYRYAVLNDSRVIVDAASRRIVYVVR
ncbi:hypothetical protein FHR70_000428 [Microvirga lupini]|uniref:DUF1236 domain-containing protein n=1 Tax=Microvirga lupini TaxID=420324 RepID=A0A7W4VHM7_9HYPH|nr:DUF1236 domain-containing protein [Microvirga lupini]MBB3017388.1 hypothetical protein [Microvirga lupini]